jgi:hypothetical protein
MVSRHSGEPLPRCPGRKSVTDREGPTPKDWERMAGIVKSPGRKSVTEKANHALPAKSTVRKVATKGAISKVQPARRKVQPTRRKTNKKEGTRWLFGAFGA